MKNLNSMISLAGVCISLAACGQNISQTKVPAVVVNSFQQQYPKTNDVEWERKGSLYEVEFETGLSGVDHKILLDSLGKITYHKVDINESELPEQVKSSISQQFAGYRVDDVKKIESNGLVTYTAELKKKPEEWKITFGFDGKILDKTPD